MRLAWRPRRRARHAPQPLRRAARSDDQARYYLRGGGEHGSSFLGAQDFDINARSARSLLIDAGIPDDVSGRPAIRKCAPLLYLLD